MYIRVKLHTCCVGEDYRIVGIVIFSRGLYLMNWWFYFDTAKIKPAKSMHIIPRMTLAVITKFIPTKRLLIALIQTIPSETPPCHMLIMHATCIILTCTGQWV